MRAFRLCRAAFKALDGEGARLYGGRWSAPGRPVIYASTTLALAALEYLVHVDPVDVPTDLTALTIGMPDDVTLETVDVSSLPPKWMHAAGSRHCEALGNAWLEAAKSAVLRVPAAPVPEEFNLLLNPRHPDAARFQVIAERPFAYDPRLLL